MQIPNAPTADGDLRAEQLINAMKGNYYKQEDFPDLVEIVNDMTPQQLQALHAALSAREIAHAQSALVAQRRAVLDDLIANRLMLQSAQDILLLTHHIAQSSNSPSASNTTQAEIDSIENELRLNEAELDRLCADMRAQLQCQQCF
ncbi:hypothetical protein IAT40_007911 [Kwoniella sp. CBS 6097]